ncbi:MAG: hypothetical protein ACK4K7_05040 [Allosphingosinicella sp.]|uniref:hypothetical protein n=1 Tax=Allosphingosinicella sp. TaxID=2823234 RepID=UPI003955AAA8
MRTIVAAALGAALLAACGQQNEAGGGLSADENRRLNEHAEVLDTSPDSMTAEDVGLDNEAWLNEAEPANTN